MASTNKQPPVAIDADYIISSNEQILPQNELSAVQFQTLTNLTAINKEVEQLNELVGLTQTTIRQMTFNVPEKTSSSGSASSSSSSSSGSASTQRYETSWGEPILLETLLTFMEAHKMIIDAIDVDLNTTLATWFNNGLKRHAQLEAVKADWYKSMGKKLKAFMQTPAYARIQKAEKEKDKRIAHSRQIIRQSWEATLRSLSESLLAAKRALLEVLDNLPVPSSDLSEEMRAAIHAFRLTSVPWVDDDLPQPEPSWIDRIGYEMRDLLNMD